MKIIYTTIIYFIIFTIIYGCKNNDRVFIYNIGNNKRIELLLLNNKKYIECNKTVPVKFIIKGIKLNQLRIFAPGISISVENDSILKGNIFLKKKYIKSFPNIKKDTFHIKINIVENSGKINEGEILVPLKI